MRCRLSPTADVPSHTSGAAMCHVWTAPSWQGLSSRLQHWSVQPCVRPLDAAHMTAVLKQGQPFQALTVKEKFPPHPPEFLKWSPKWSPRLWRPHKFLERGTACCCSISPGLTEPKHC